MIKKLAFTQKPFRLLLILTITISCDQKGTDYPAIFGRSYFNAQLYFKENHWVNDSLQKYKVDPNIVIPTIFPEVLRYSSLQDRIEIHSLEVLYTQYGSKYADFSIGQFQIKPSFAYQIEKDWNHISENNQFKALIMPFDTLDTPELRLQRIIRLKDPKWQIKYVVMFVKIAEQKFNLVKLENIEKIKLLSTAYNAGYWNDLKTLNRLNELKFYHTSIIKPSRCYSYSDIAIDFYKKQMPK